MTEELLLVLLGLLVAFNVGHFATLKKCEQALLSLTIESTRLTDFDPGHLFDEMREEVGQMVEAVVASMRQPTIADHLGGVVSQFAQMRMMKMLQAENLGSLVPRGDSEPQFTEVHEEPID